MNDPFQDLHRELDRTRQLLAEGELLTLSPEDRRALAAESEELLHRLDTLALSSLTVGLLGGTGVGKSTLMNALAGSEIATTSHRRPHTHKVLVYRHEATPLPSALKGSSVPREEFLHSADPLTQIVLCDLPDFDSIENEHRLRVIRLLEHLDVVVWVSSPEKYADAKFYELLEEVPKARENFYFVLNKLDLLFQGEAPEKGYERAAKVAESFRRHIVRHSVSDPLIFALSAREASQEDGCSSWNQFPVFRHQLFQRRDLKEIKAIKTANLDVEVQRLLSALREEASRLAAVHRVVDKVLGEEAPQGSGWKEEGRRILDEWAQGRVEEEIVWRLEDPSALWGAGRLLARLDGEWRRWRRGGLAGGPGEARGKGVPAWEPPDELLSAFRGHLERVENRMATDILRRGLPGSLAERIDEMLEARRQQDELRRKMSHFLRDRTANPDKPSFRLFGMAQFVAYWALFAVFAGALAGDTLRQESGPDGFPGWMILLLSTVGRLFTPAGLAALGSYGLLNLFLGSRFYDRYKKLLRRRSRKFIESLEAGLESLWEEALEAISSRLKDIQRQLERQMAALPPPREERKEN